MSTVQIRLLTGSYDEEHQLGDVLKATKVRAHGDYDAYRTESGWNVIVYEDPANAKAGDWSGELVTTDDAVEHPKHYTSHPSGIEAIEITRHFLFSIGNAIKYLWRAGLKKDLSLDDIDKEIEDLRKAKWYIDDRITQLEEEKYDRQTS